MMGFWKPVLKVILVMIVIRALRVLKMIRGLKRAAVMQVSMSSILLETTIMYSQINFSVSAIILNMKGR